tara:strand:- start:196 stop:1191 length:996 start_codon:yes stop_codon:yes gene_type:complete
MNYLLDKLLNNEYLEFQEAHDFIISIEEETYTPEIISGMLMIIQMRGAQLEEMRGFRSALLKLALTLELDSENAIDLCGTGGDGKNTFNISTTTAFVLAAMGKKVIKHGNYGVSSLCGSSNVLEELGIKFTHDNGELQRQLDNRNICFLHAPLFHPTMKKVAPIRRSLGVRTIFNSLGPLVNPSQPKFQLTGTYSLELAKVYQSLLRSDRSNYRVIYGMDGFDELSLTDDARVFGGQSEQVINAATFGINQLAQSTIHGGCSVSDSAQILRAILEGRGTEEQNLVVAANTALALQLYHPYEPIKELFTEALQFIKSGKANFSSFFPKTMYL